MEISERKHDMPNKIDKDILVSATDISEEEKKEYNEWIDKPKTKEEKVDDLDNQYYSEGEIL
jgi:hypothetical protein|tara:strand:- start:110 stop:295 length:186 start_codon:yes stop_codon:yes gene_type:complete